MSEEEKLRLKKIIETGTVLLCAGLGYAFVLMPNGITIPCYFYKLTNLRCPGCGVSRMCYALLTGNIKEAISYNYGLFAVLPCLAVIIGGELWKYVRGANDRLYMRIERIMSTLLLAYFLIWFVVRNCLGI